MSAFLGTLLGGMIGPIVTSVFMFLIGSAAQKFVTPMVNAAIGIATEPMSIPVVSQVILWGQLCALVIVACIRVGKGVYEFILAKGEERSESFGGWIARSLLAVAGVALMPVFCNMVIAVGHMALSEVQAVGSGNVSLTCNGLSEDVMASLAEAPMDTLSTYVASSIFALLLCALCAMVAYQLLKREYVLLEVCVMATWVSIKAGMDRTDDYVDLLTSLFALCITQWTQYLFFLVAVATVGSVSGDANWVALSNWDEVLPSIVMVLASMGAALAVPSVLERYAFSSGRGGAGTLIVATALRGGFRGLGNVGRTIGGALGAATR